MKKQLNSPSLDDVFDLTRGRASTNRVGSRDVAHRLQQHEQRKLQIARERGYLLVNRKTRKALRNSWLLLCQAEGRECVIVSREGDKLKSTTIS